jgi:hypothetical protein
VRACGKTHPDARIKRDAGIVASLTQLNEVSIGFGLADLKVRRSADDVKLPIA